MFERLERILKEEEFQRLKKIHILLIGIGGVGGYTFEALIRSGIENITIIDYDRFDITNMNRQILCTTDSLQKKKVEQAYQRAKLINEKAKVIPIEKQLKKEEITKEFLQKYDYIIDACDDVDVKVRLIEVCSSNDLTIISCMGTGNRFHPEMLKITSLNKTKNDPLARKIRQKLNKNTKALNTPVLWSEELPIKGKGLGTFCPVPMSAGAILASYIIKKEN